MFVAAFTSAWASWPHDRHLNCDWVTQSWSRTPTLGSLAPELVTDGHGQLLHPAQVGPGRFPGLDRRNHRLPLLGSRIACFLLCLLRLGLGHASVGQVFLRLRLAPGGVLDAAEGRHGHGLTDQSHVASLTKLVATPRSALLPLYRLRYNELCLDRDRLRRRKSLKPRIDISV